MLEPLRVSIYILSFIYFVSFFVCVISLYFTPVLYILTFISVAVHFAGNFQYVSK